MTTIAIDAMGGDYAPDEIIQGAIQGAKRYNIKVLLVGQPDLINQSVKKLDFPDKCYDIVEASEVIEMGESAAAIRKKKNASIIVAAKCVKQGQAQALVAAGSTGAAMSAALLYIGRIEGIERPAIGLVLPSSAPSPCILLDAGANADCTAEMLTQFALMGNVFMQSVYQIDTPKIGLLNIGEEAGKGNALALQTYDQLMHDGRFQFIGNIEGHNLFTGGADVAVADGFSGNIALKSAEGVMTMFRSILKNEFESSQRKKLGYLFAKPALKGAIRHVDPEEFGGALLLGINGVCVISHGGSHARAVENAIRVAVHAIETKVIDRITSQI
ncbi:MAG: phosphate acyltransferase PlsX [Cyanobacteria bacterium P01_H01_bin.74]